MNRYLPGPVLPVDPLETYPTTPGVPLHVEIAELRATLALRDRRIWALLRESVAMFELEESIVDLRRLLQQKEALIRQLEMRLGKEVHV